MKDNAYPPVSPPHSHTSILREKGGRAAKELENPGKFLASRRDSEATKTRKKEGKGRARPSVKRTNKHDKKGAKRYRQSTR